MKIRRKRQPGDPDPLTPGQRKVRNWTTAVLNRLLHGRVIEPGSPILKASPLGQRALEAMGFERPHPKGRRLKHLPAVPGRVPWSRYPA